MPKFWKEPQTFSFYVNFSYYVFCISSSSSTLYLYLSFHSPTLNLSSFVLLFIFQIFSHSSLPFNDLTIIKNFSNLQSQNTSKRSHFWLWFIYPQKYQNHRVILLSNSQTYSKHIRGWTTFFLFEKISLNWSTYDFLPWFKSFWW